MQLRSKVTFRTSQVLLTAGKYLGKVFCVLVVHASKSCVVGRWEDTADWYQGALFSTPPMLSPPPDLLPSQNLPPQLHLYDSPLVHPAGGPSSMSGTLLPLLWEPTFHLCCEIFSVFQIAINICVSYCYLT